MALHFDLMVNHRTIGRFVARRVQPTTPKGYYLYEITVSTQDGDVQRVTVAHRYGAGAWALVMRSLNALAAQQLEP